MALTCHQIGVPVKVYESVRELQPLGVGINLQPNAVRELFDLGLADELPKIGIAATEWALVGKNGNDIWTEPRGLLAGYKWPQFSVHRGQLQMMLYQAVIDRLGADAVETGCRVLGYENRHDRVTVEIERRGVGHEEIEGSVLLAGDGLHSAVRQQMHPDQPDPQWGGAILWRGTALGPPIRSGAAFTVVGSLNQRFIHYPISHPDPETGLHLQNWIAELTFDPRPELNESSWNKEVDAEVFLPAFEDWNFDWLDIPAMVRSAERIWEFPMVDRDPVEHWVEGQVALMGDAAHVMYPVGSNGASQAIVDSRVLGAKMLSHGVNANALLAYEADLIEAMSALVLRNRGAGPLAILGVVDERCGGVFDDIDDVIPRSEVEEFMANYKSAAGFAVETLNSAPPTISASI